MTHRTMPIALLLVAMLVGSALPAAAADKPAQDTTVKAIVGLSGALPTTIPGVDVVRVSPQGGYVAVEAPSVLALQIATAALPGVLYVEADETLTASVVPNDPRYASQYGPDQMGTEQAWDAVGFGDDAISVAVLDTGLRTTHEDFQAARLGPVQVYTGNANDNCGHGTHVAGTVGATTGNGRGVAGMSQARLLTYKVLDAAGGLFSVQCSGSTSAIAQAVYDATDAGADIINMSLGGGGFSQTFSNAVDYAWNNGVLVVAASGNDGANNGVGYPARYPNAIAVGALDANKNRASYSNGGPELDVVAPGSSVISTYNGSNTSYSTLSGTSMATPHVAGALALAWSCAPAGTTNVTMRQALESTTEDLGASGFDTAYGHGLVRTDLLVAAVCDGGGDPDPDPVNTAPVAAFTSATSDLTVTVDAAASSDADGDTLSYAWTFGDGSSATGVTASHTYAAAGTYTVSLTVSDGNGGSDTTSTQVTVQAATGGGDPDPSTPTITPGQPVTVTLSGTGDEKFYKVEVPAGASSLTVTIDGPGCGLFGCSFDADLYTRAGQRPTDTAYDCRPFANGSDETCTRSNPPAGFTYIRVDSYSGSGSLTLTARVS